MMIKLKKKIVWLAHEANISGANIAMLEYIDHLSDLFDFVVILPHTGNMQDALQTRYVACKIVHQYGWANTYSWWEIKKWTRVAFRTAVAILQTTKIIKQEKAALVFTNTLVPFTASVSARMLGKAHVWWIHEFGEEDFGIQTGWGNKKWSLKWMQTASQLIIVNSHSVARKFQRLMPEANIQTIYQPVSWKKHNSTELAKQAQFLMFGQIAPSKGHIEVLQALVYNRQLGKQVATLHIKGPNEIKPYLAELRLFVQKHQLEDKVKIVAGFFNKEETMPQYDALIVASKAEAFGRVIVEANKAGLHVVVKNNGGSPELVNDTNGLLYKHIHELAAILAGETVFPTGSLNLAYKEEEEIGRLKKMLSKII